MSDFVIELWDIDTHHPFLATDDAGEVMKFGNKVDAQLVADKMRDSADGEFLYDYYITTTPSRFAKPLQKLEE